NGVVSSRCLGASVLLTASPRAVVQAAFELTLLPHADRARSSASDQYVIVPRPWSGRRLSTFQRHHQLKMSRIDAMITLTRVPLATPSWRLRNGTGISLMCAPFHHVLSRHSGLVNALSLSSGH